MMLACYVYSLVYVATLVNSQAVNGFSTSGPDPTRLSNERDQIFSRLSHSMPEKLGIKMFLTDFQSFDTVSAYLDQLAAYSVHAESVVIGSSFEGRNLKLIRITANNSRTIKPIIFLTAGMNGDDLATIPTALYVAYSLIKSWQHDSLVNTLLDAFEFHILPIANPDGYHYSLTVDPKWKKNRSYSSNSTCLGVDQNRNWNSHFNESGISGDPCNQNFAGPNAFSEIETHVISNYIQTRKNQIKMFVLFHSSLQSWFSPYCYTKKLSKNYIAMLYKSQIAVDAIAKVNHVSYAIGSFANRFQLASGLSSDWALDSAGIPYSYIVAGRLKPTGTRTPKTQIKPIAEELWAGVHAVSKELLKEHREDNLRNLNTGCRC